MLTKRTFFYLPHMFKIANSLFKSWKILRFVDFSSILLGVQYSCCKTFLWLSNLNAKPCPQIENRSEAPSCTLYLLEYKIHWRFTILLVRFFALMLPKMRSVGNPEHITHTNCATMAALCSNNTLCARNYNIKRVRYRVNSM